MTDPQTVPGKVVPLGRFTARVVAPDGLLYLGTNRTFTREPASYEAGHTIIEIYDSKFMHTPLGQFVSAYSARTLAEGAGKGGRLSLQGGTPEWTMSVEETAKLRELAQKAVQDE